MFLQQTCVLRLLRDFGALDEDSEVLPPELDSSRSHTNERIDIPNKGKEKNDWKVPTRPDISDRTTTSVARIVIPEIKGQHETFCHVNTTQYNRVVKNVTTLRDKGKLGNLSVPVKQETYTGDSQKNTVAVRPSVKLAAIIAQLTSVLLQPVKYKRIIKPCLREGETLTNCAVLTYLEKLITNLQTPAPIDQELLQEPYNTVQLWECDSHALLYSDVVQDKHWWAVSAREFSDRVTHIYISRAHPNPAEAVIHCFMQYYGFSHDQCVLLESLVAEKGALDKYGNRKYPFISDRLSIECEQSSIRHLLSLIQGTRKQFDKITDANHPPLLHNTLISMAEQIHMMCYDTLMNDDVYDLPTHSPSPNSSRPST
eukprot:TRINITY_DN2379_c0_g1_i3.p1 TRINITY_DN2379_c0_g1~~TRINITY_DN2379_c0_g1_i3.p1  ORF type:complete len:408 (-),score=102.34 TRINITY_DN2379_c0_g1_i3:108-1217(-)